MSDTIQISINDLQGLDFINRDTGEFIPGEEFIKNKSTSSKSRTYRHLNKSEIALYIKEILGRFYQIYYESLPEDMDSAIKFRFIYLCTYINYKNNILMIDDVPIKKNELRAILRLAKKQFYEFLHYLENNKLILYTKENYIKINKNVCNRGNAKQYVPYSRIFENTIKEIYESSKTREHKLLGLLFNLLPYLHINNNAICSNPTEEDYTHIDYLSGKRVTKLLNCSSRTFKNMCALKITSKKEKAVICIKLDTNKYGYILNPKLSYKGSKYAATKSIIDMFDMYR